MTLSPLQIVVCGTDTDVGKTVVSAWLVQGLHATYWKPVQSGLDEGGDRDRICQLLNLPPERWLREAYAFRRPLSHWAAEYDGIGGPPVSASLQRPLVVETAGG